LRTSCEWVSVAVLLSKSPTSKVISAADLRGTAS
jgi:hypothetical protein